MRTGLPSSVLATGSVMASSTVGLGHDLAPACRSGCPVASADGLVATSVSRPIRAAWQSKSALEVSTSCTGRPPSLPSLAAMLQVADGLQLGAASSLTQHGSSPALLLHLSTCSRMLVAVAVQQGVDAGGVGDHVRGGRRERLSPSLPRWAMRHHVGRALGAGVVHGLLHRRRTGSSPVSSSKKP